MKINNTIHIKLIAVSVTALLFLIPGLQGCNKKDQPPKPSKQVKAQKDKAASGTPQEEQPASTVQVSIPEEGYVYKPGDRRDPFVPLIVSTKKKTETKGVARLGTLESYDVSEFALLAIARKGEKPYALLLTPDNRSFTVSKGTIIGLNKGRVEDITENKVIFVEYVKDFRGDIRPRKITLELSKER